MSVLLLSFSVPQIISHKWTRYRQWRCFRGSRLEEHIPSRTGRLLKKAPDIYYIILDGYVRDDVLKDLFAYDNSGLIEYLRGRGFFVAEQSRSNYRKSP